MTITRNHPDGKSLVVDLKTWQFIAAIFTIVVASIALATPWTRYQSQIAVAPRIDSIEVQLKSAAEKAARVEERLTVTKETTDQQRETTDKRLDRIENKLDRLLERQK